MARSSASFKPSMPRITSRLDRAVKIKDTKPAKGNVMMYGRPANTKKMKRLP